MKKKYIMSFILLSLALILSACGKGKKEIRMGTGDTGGTYYVYSEKLAEILKDDITIQLKSTVGSEANLRLLQKGFIDAAIVQSDALYRSEKKWEDEKEKGNASSEKRTYSAVAGLYTEVLQIVVREDSDIKNPKDLKGKNVSLGPDESGVLKNALEILDAVDLKESDVNPYYLSFTEAAEALKEGRIDAFFCMAGAPTGAVTELAKAAGIRILSLKDNMVSIMLKLYPYYVECKIPEGTYEGQSEEIRTVGVRAVFVVSNSLDKATVSDITGKIIDNSGILNQNIVTDGSLSALDASTEVTVPFHRGAAEYLKKRGVVVKEDLSDSGGMVFGSQDFEGGAE